MSLQRGVVGISQDSECVGAQCLETVDCVCTAKGV